MTARHPVFALADAFVDESVALSPTLATFLGVAGATDRWDDESPEGYEQKAALYRRYQERLGALPPGAEPFDQLAIRVFGEFLELALEPIDAGDHLHDLGHIQSLVPELQSVLDSMDRSNVAGWADVASRLERLGEPLAGLRSRLELGRSRGLLAARRQARSIITQLRALGAEAGAFTVLVAGFSASGLAADHPELGARLDAALASAAAASEAMADWLEAEYLPTALEADGVGAEQYARNAKAFLGTVLDLEETYRWGWAHLLEIRAEMDALADRIAPGQSLPDVVRLLEQDPARCAATQEEFRALMQQRLEQAMADLEGTHFDIPEEIRACEVRLAPIGAPLGAWFMSPSEDFARPGTTYWSLGTQEPVPVWDQVTTAYHEGFPGHHLQCGLQVWLRQDLSRVHRMLFWLPGYGEGWALYAERLMRELGYFEEPAYELGMLAGSAMRAARVAVDIGLHLGLPIPDDSGFHPGEAWTFDVAVEAIETFGFQPHDFAVSEVTRYLGWPGQAISYKVGERVILQLRDEARRRAGDAFDLKAFHSTVLGSGPVGLDHLREIVLG